MAKTPSPAPVDPTEAFESLILLAHRWTGLVGDSSIMAAHSLTVPGFIVLASAAAEPGTAAGKLARNAGLEKTEAAAALRTLKAAGLVEQQATPESKRAAFTVTAKGRETLAALRADFAAAAKQVPEANWRAIPRLAAILRRSARALGKPAAEAAAE